MIFNDIGSNNLRYFMYCFRIDDALNPRFRFYAEFPIFLRWNVSKFRFLSINIRQKFFSYCGTFIASDFLSYLERLTQGGFGGQNQITNFIIWGHARCYPMPFSPKIRVLALKLASRGQILEYGSFQWF